MNRTLLTPYSGVLLNVEPIRNGTELRSVVRTELSAVTTTSKVHFMAEYCNLVELLTELHRAGKQTFLGK